MGTERSEGQTVGDTKSCPTGKPPAIEWVAEIKINFPSETFCVEGADFSDAHADAQRLGDKLAAKIGYGATASVAIGRQIGEPWLRVPGGEVWYDLHGPDNILVLERSHGNTFTEADVELLKGRIEATGLGVIESWNGAGCGTVSFRCKGREPKDSQFTDKQIEALSAPRPKEASNA